MPVLTTQQRTSSSSWHSQANSGDRCIYRRWENYALNALSGSCTQGWEHTTGTPDLGAGVRECFPQEVMVKEDKVKRGVEGGRQGRDVPGKENTWGKRLEFRDVSHVLRFLRSSRSSVELDQRWG